MARHEDTYVSLAFDPADIGPHRNVSRIFAAEFATELDSTTAISASICTTISRTALRCRGF
jgi:hypothetical protein